METTIAVFFRHNLWANLQLLDTCASLSDDDLDASAPGTYGTVRDTWYHLCGAEERYIWLLTDEQMENSLPRDGAFPGFAALRTHAQRSGERLITLAETIDPALVLRGERNGAPYEIHASAILLQAINHATEHRSHITTILSQRGIALPDLDGWSFEEQVMRSSQ